MSYEMTDEVARKSLWCTASKEDYTARDVRIIS